MPEREGKPARVPRVSLGELTRGKWTLRVSCPRCLNSTVLHPTTLAMRVGWSRSLEKLRFRCSRCGSRGGRPHLSVAEAEA